MQDENFGRECFLHPSKDYSKVGVVKIALSLINFTTYIFINIGGQHSSLAAHWLSVAGDHGSNPGRGETFFLSFLELLSNDCHLLGRFAPNCYRL